MTQTATPCGGMAILAMSGHGQDARATSCGKESPETVGCELAAQMLRSFGKLRLRATGSSMLPAVWPGDVLSVCSHAAAEALPGDIVLFGREGRLFAHRVVEKRDTGHGTRDTRSGARGAVQRISETVEGTSLATGSELGVPCPVSRIPCPVSRVQFVTRGDSLDRNDPPISSHELLGRVTAIERGSRRVNPRLTFWRRIASAILSRSEFCTRVLLWMRKSRARDTEHVTEELKSGGSGFGVRDAGRNSPGTGCVVCSFF